MERFSLRSHHAYILQQLTFEINHRKWDGGGGGGGVELLISEITEAPLHTQFRKKPHNSCLYLTLTNCLLNIMEFKENYWPHKTTIYGNKSSQIFNRTRQYNIKFFDIYIFVKQKTKPIQATETKK